MDIPETIKILQSKIANETTLGGKEINDLTEALEQVGFALTPFENLDEEYLMSRGLFLPTSVILYI